MRRYAIHPVVCRCIVRSALVILAASPLVAQDFSLGGAEIFPSAGNNMSIARTDVGADLHIPLRGGRTHLLQGFRHQRLSISGWSSTPLLGPSQLQYTRYEAGLVQQLASSWAATMFFSPGFAYRVGEGYSRNSVHVRTGFLASRRVRDHLTYGFGVTYRNGLKRPVLPIVQVNGTIGRHLQADVMLPSRARLRYIVTPDERVAFGVHARYGATPYYIGDATALDEPRHMVHSYATAGPSLHVGLKGAYNLVVDGGYALWNRLSFRGGGRDAELNLGGGLYLRAAVEIRFRKLSLASKQVRVRSAAVPDRPDAVRRLSTAIQQQTVTHPDTHRVEADAFLAFHDFLEEAYPRVHAEMVRETVSDYSLLYTWRGTDSTLDPVLFAGHLDVVPVDPATETEWTYPPFDGHSDGTYVWGRGAIDNRFTVIGIMEAVERLLADGFAPERTIYLAFGHDEERGGPEGARRVAALLASRGEELAYVLDEGPCITEGIVPGVRKPVALIGIAEKGAVTLKLTVKTSGGHSSAPQKETAIGLLSRAVSRLEAHQMPSRLDGVAQEMMLYLVPEMSFAKRMASANLWLFEPLVERQLSRARASNTIIRTTTAPTMLRSGFKENVLPAHAEAVVNFRILPGDSVSDVIEHVRRVVRDSRVHIDTLGVTSEPSEISSTASRHFKTLQRTISEIFPSAAVVPSLMIARTDSRHYAGLTTNIYRFEPVRVGPDDVERIHGVDERVGIDDFVRGIAFYSRLIQNSTGGTKDRRKEDVLARR